MTAQDASQPLLDSVGQTPLLRVSNQVLFKLEYESPHRSIADRIVRVLIRMGSIDGPLRIDVVDPLSVSAIGLTRVERGNSTYSAVLHGAKATTEGGETTRLLDPYSGSGTHEGFADRLVKYRHSALLQTWVEIAQEVRSTMSRGTDSLTFVVPELPWLGLGRLPEQYQIAREALGGNVLVAAVREHVRHGSDEKGIRLVSRSSALAAAKRIGKELGVTTYLLGGAVASCCVESSAHGTIIGIIADSAEWHDFALAEHMSDAGE